MLEQVDTSQRPTVFAFRCLLFWGGGSCFGPTDIRTFVTLWNRHATDAERGKSSWLLTIDIMFQYSFISSCLLSFRQKMAITQKITPGHGSANGRWSKSRAWSWRQCLVLVTRASKIWATHATSARWCRSSSASLTFRGCEYTVIRANSSFLF